MNRLWVRSFAATALTVVITLLAFGVFSNREISMTIARSGAHGEERALAAVARRLRLDPGRAQAILNDGAARTDREYVLAAHGSVVASAPSNLNGASVRFAENRLLVFDVRDRRHQLRLIDPAVVVVPGGTLFSAPAFPPTAVSAHVERTLITGLAITIALVLSVTLVLTRSILAPIGRLTRAARRVSQGDYAQTIAPAGATELAELASAFNTMARALQRDRELRETLVRDLAHEIRTPLTNAACAIEAMQDGLVTIDRDAIDAIRADLALLERLIDGVQDVALVRVAPPDLQRAAVDVAALVEPAARAFTAQANAKGVRIATAVPAGLPQADADRDRVRQVVANLVGNALRHTPAGGTIRLEAAHVEDAIVVAVSDTGEGIAPADLPAIFERTFSRSGSGLGLAIARDIVEAHGGTIGASSAPGTGTTVRFTLPIAALTTS